MPSTLGLFFPRIDNPGRRDLSPVGFERHIGFLIVLLALFGPAPAVAQARQVSAADAASWAVADRVHLGTIYVDTARVLEAGDAVYLVRTRWSFTGKRPSESVALRAVNCRTREMAILSYVDRNDHGVTGAAERPLYAVQWDAVTPDSPVDRVAKWVCGSARGAPRLAVRAPAVELLGAPVDALAEGR